MEKVESFELINSKPSEIIELSSDEDLDCSFDEEDYQSDSTPLSSSSNSTKGASLKMKIDLVRTNVRNKSEMGNGKEISDDYEFLEKIGEGAFGKVYRVVSKDNGKTFAVKLLYKKDLTGKKQLLSETENLKRLDHPNIIRLYEYYETKTKVFLV
jgi:hypothetical protein